MKNPVNASSSGCLKNLTCGPSKLVKSFNGRNSIGDKDDNNEDEQGVEWSPMMKRKSFNRKEEGLPGDVYSAYDVSTFGINFYSSGMFASLSTTSIPSVTLTLFPQLLYSSLAPISTPSSSSAVGTLSRPAPSSSARPQAPPV
ncbi:hypothetical protein M9H77_07447 [Catharanthus roseus]|uniref:Uncharacterized protein n=2 Tax=Catharanthus roseus TaxID=4058 RepID=A0ACC0BV78_CATRO|nr:hypothetical protein M9H77_07445 [Catharanthus roseus]KAI5676497.1 hypothetical protein M9H77_07447 [Catharanthus roseus]